MPTAKITATASADKVTASVAVSGGTAPYAIYWNSSHTTFSPSLAQSGSKLTYSVMSQTSQALVDTVSATVIDANGLITTAKLPVTVLTPQILIRLWTDIPGARVGTEWIGLSAGLGGSAANAVYGRGPSSHPMRLDARGSKLAACRGHLGCDGAVPRRRRQQLQRPLLGTRPGRAGYSRPGYRRFLGAACALLDL
jgi:hypothetical protein